jgi:hypothetical protein
LPGFLSHPGGSTSPLFSFLLMPAAKLGILLLLIVGGGRGDLPFRIGHSIWTKDAPEGSSALFSRNRRDTEAENEQSVRLAGKEVMHKPR